MIGRRKECCGGSLSALYRCLCRGETPALPPLPIQHGDYAVWQRQKLTEADVAEDLAFWTENLRGAPALLELPSDRPRPQAMSYRGARKRFRINSALTTAFRQLSRQEKKSLFALFTAAWDALLYRYTGQEDILLGIPVAERDRPELQSMIGFLLHTHVLRTVVQGEMTFQQLAAEVQHAALKLYEHRSRAVRSSGAGGAAGTEFELHPAVSGDGELARPRSTLVLHRPGRVGSRVGCWPRVAPANST